MIDFPAAPIIDETHVAADITFRWNGVAWMANQPPSAGLRDAPADTLTYARKDGAWAPLTNVYGTFLLEDGQFNAPALAFKNEPGLGFYRPGEGSFYWTYKGGVAAATAYSDTSAGWTFYPPVEPGESHVYLTDAPGGTPDSRYFFMRCDWAGCHFGEETYGETIPGKLHMRFPQGVELAADPVDAMDAVTKQYVDANAGGFDDAPDATTHGRKAGEWVNLANHELIEVDAGRINFDRGEIGSMATLRLSGGASTIMLNSFLNQNASIMGMKGGLNRWTMELGSAGNESAGNVGNDFTIRRYDNAGALLGTALTIDRAGANATFASSWFTIAPASGGVALAIRKTASGQSNMIYGGVGGASRWSINLGDSTAESAPATGSDFSISRYNNSGAFLGDALKIKRSGGAAILSCNSGTSSPADYNLTLEQTEPGQGAYLLFKSPAGNKTIRTGNYFEILNTAATQAILQLSDAGALTVPLHITISGAGALYINPGNGMQYASGGFNYDGSGYQCMAMYGNPNWGIVYHRAYHQPGVWAGHFFYVQGMGFQMHNNGHFIANGIDLGSDARTKTKAQPIADAASLFADCQAFEYERLLAKEYDGTPVQEIGLMAQDIQRAMPKAVRQDKATDDEPEPLRRIDLGAMNALAAQAIGELLARVRNLESELQTLKGATP